MIKVLYKFGIIINNNNNNSLIALDKPYLPINQHAVWDLMLCGILSCQGLRLSNLCRKVDTTKPSLVKMAVWLREMICVIW